MLSGVVRGVLSETLDHNRGQIKQKRELYECPKEENSSGRQEKACVKW